MGAIDKIYSNEVGISFFWNKNTSSNIPKIQIVFRDIGFLLTLNELKDFSDSCIVTKHSECCGHCTNHQECKSLLLRTPSDKIDLAVNKKELQQFHELISGTIFRIEMKKWIKNLCLN